MTRRTLCYLFRLGAAERALRSGTDARAILHRAHRLRAVAPAQPLVAALIARAHLLDETENPSPAGDAFRLPVSSTVH